ncbi:MAG: hypothetical protein P8Y67_01120 [Alphaproteobacteria bacterium]
MEVVYNIFLLLVVFVILKAGQIIFDFAYTTYKSITIHKNLAHAFNPGLMYRLKRGLIGDIVYYFIGIVVAVNATQIRDMLL